MIEATLDGRPVELLTLSLSTDIDSYCLSCDATLAEAADWRRAAPGAELHVTAACTTFRFLLDNRARDRRFGDESWRIQARSPASRLDAPYAAPISRTWTATTARTIAQELCTAAGLALDWRIIDFPLAEYVAERQTPLAILGAIKTEAAALLSQPDGSLVICWRYPVTPARYAEALPAATLSDAHDLLQLDDSYDHRPAYNRVGVLADSRAAAQEVRLQEWTSPPAGSTAPVETIPPGHKIVVAATWPPLTLTLHTSCAQAAIHAEPWLEFEFAETVELQRGQGSLSWPATELLAVSWRSADLGQLTLAGAAVTAAQSGQSLVEVRYRVRLQRWRVTCADQGKVQCYADYTAQEPASGPGVTHVVRWPGDRPAPELIVDPLCTTQAIATERGRNWLDDQGYPKQRYTASTPPRTWVLPGAVLEVQDATLAETWRARLTGWRYEASLGIDGPQGRVTLDVERVVM